MGTVYNKPAVGPAWGDTAVNPADIITMQPNDVSTGWTLSGTPPSRQRFNYVLNWATAAIRYFMQRGLADYDANETYQQNALIIGDDGNTYRSLINTNIGSTPSTHPGQWVAWGLTLAQVNASQLTQANISQGDNSAKVANTNFVTTGLSQLSATITAAYNAAISTAVSAASATLNASINAVQTNLNNAVTTLNASIASAINTATNNAIAAITPGMSSNFAATGHFRLPNWSGGFQICWGTVDMGGGGTSSFEFNTPFPNQCFAVIPGTSGYTDRISYVDGFTQYGGTLGNNGSGVSCSYIAVGY